MKWMNDISKLMTKNAYLRIGLNDDVPFRTPSSAVRHAVTLVILLASAESREKSIEDEHWSTNDLTLSNLCRMFSAIIFIVLR